ncbi:UPF0489 family protein [Bacillus safensis]|uniref:UPF0489 family protein n=2 Tax=Bacillaceae TaxID=186817 RepID=UPI00293CEE45|nr:UPF0489 family protein [Bacillus safensis]MDV3448807.1 UPF0489 family protein [Bacillus safensis]
MRDLNKIYFPEKKIFLMDQHKWAFYIWELAREEGLIMPNATLFHVDAHLDDVPSVLQDNPEYIDIEGLENIKSFTDKSIQNFTFIWPAFGRETINNIIYVSDFSRSDPFEEWTRENVAGRIYEGIRVHSIEELKDSILLGEVEPYVHNNSLILNLDLDFFNEEEFYDRDPKIKSDQEVMESLTYLKNLYKWDLITVSLSPEYCGGEEACDHLLKLFLKVFKLDLNTGILWNK